MPNRAKQIEWKLLYKCSNTQYYLYDKILVWHYNLLIRHAGHDNFIPTSRISHWQTWYFTYNILNKIVNKKIFWKIKLFLCCVNSKNGITVLKLTMRKKVEKSTFVHYFYFLFLWCFCYIFTWKMLWCCIIHHFI